MKHLKNINEFFFFNREENSLSFQDGDTVMTPDGEGVVIPNTENDGNIWVRLNDESKSNPLTGNENVYRPEEVTRIKD